VLLGNYESVAS